jgi:hypothetical protein
MACALDHLFEEKAKPNLKPPKPISLHILQRLCILLIFVGTYPGLMGLLAELLMGLEGAMAARGRELRPVALLPPAILRRKIGFQFNA